MVIHGFPITPVWEKHQIWVVCACSTSQKWVKIRYLFTEKSIPIKIMIGQLFSKLSDLVKVQHDRYCVIDLIEVPHFSGLEMSEYHLC